MGELKYVYVVSKVLGDGFAFGHPGSVFTSKEKALNECKRLAECALENEAKFWKDIHKDEWRRVAKLWIAPSQKAEMPGFLVMIKNVRCKRGGCLKAFFVTRKLLDARSPKWAER